jgi:hypothetical protein
LSACGVSLQRRMLDKIVYEVEKCFELTGMHAIYAIYLVFGLLVVDELCAHL